MSIAFIRLDPRAHVEDLGYFPYFLDERDPRSAKEQIHANYAHGGGWNSFKMFNLDRETMALSFPDDPPIRPKFLTVLRDESIFVYPLSWVLILQQDGTYDVARID